MTESLSLDANGQNLDPRRTTGARKKQPRRQIDEAATAAPRSPPSLTCPLPSERLTHHCSLRERRGCLAEPGERSLCRRPCHRGVRSTHARCCVLPAVCCRHGDMAFTATSGAARHSEAARFSHAAKALPVTNAHFARRVRLAEDVRHARMLHSILHRPVEARTGSFLTLNRHDYFARTLAARKRNERAYREFSRQKENLLLLQRLQQIAYKEDESAKAATIAHQRKHDEALQRLQSRPRVGSSLVFQKVNAASPLSPRNRREWDTSSSSSSNVGAHSARDGYRDTVFDRDPPPCDPRSLRERTRSAQDTQGRSGLQRQVAEERERIERELARRWQTLEASHTRPLGPEDREWDGTIDSMVRDYEEEAGLGPHDEEEAEELDRRWSQAMDPGSHFGSTTQRHRSARAQHHQQHRPASEPLDAMASQAITAAMAATAAATDPNAIDHDAAAANAVAVSLAAAGSDTARHRAIRARYVAEDESDVELEDEEQAASLHRRAEEEKEESSAAAAVHRARPHRSHRGLYDLATHPELGLGDAELEAWRLFQYEHAQRETMMQQQQQAQLHAPVPPTGRGRGRKGGGGTRAISAASSAASLRATSEYSTAASSSYATSAAYSAEAAAAAADYQSDLDSVLRMLNDDTFDAQPQQQSGRQQQPQRPRSRPSSAARDHRPVAAPAPRPRPVSAAHTRSASAQLRFASDEGSESALSRPQPPSAYAGSSGRPGGRHARTSSMAVRSSQSRPTSANAAAHPSSSHPPLPPRDPVAAALAAEHRHRAQMERAAAEEADRYFAAIEADFPSSHRELMDESAELQSPASSEKPHRTAAPPAFGFQRSTFNARHYSAQQAAATHQRAQQRQ